MVVVEDFDTVVVEVTEIVEVKVEDLPKRAKRQFEPPNPTRPGSGTGGGLRGGTGAGGTQRAATAAGTAESSRCGCRGRR